jgi:hypothetical protein
MARAAISRPIAVRWRHGEGDGLQVFEITPMRGGWRAAGVVAMEDEGAVYGVDIRLDIRADWTVKTAAIATTGGANLLLAHDGKGSWSVNGRPAPKLDGCIDLDIWPTPVTNSLPVNRLTWRKGQSRELTMAYVKAPGLQVYPDRQRYSSLGGQQFRFEAIDGDFAADIDFDGRGLVADYPPLFYRVQGPAT